MIWFIAFFYTNSGSGEKCLDAPANCTNITCTELLKCDFPKQRIKFCDPNTRCCMRSTCIHCDLECNKDFECSEGDTPCTECLNSTKLTNSENLLEPNNISKEDKTNTDNDTVCVVHCNGLNGMYSNVDNVCTPCHEECLGQCTGPGPRNCTQCKNFYNNGTCVKECSEPAQYAVGATCMPCHEGCINGGCAGPEGKFDTANGCTACFTYYDVEQNVTVYEGSNCQTCYETKEHCKNGCTRTTDGRYFCISNLSITEKIFCWAVLILGVICWILYPFDNMPTCTMPVKKKDEKKVKLEETGIKRNEGKFMHTLIKLSNEPQNHAHLHLVSDIELDSETLIDSGIFGYVHEANWTREHISGNKIKSKVAVKTLKTTEEVNQTLIKKITDNAIVMASVDCDFVVKLLGIKINENVSLVTELMPFGSLLEYVRDVKNRDNISPRHMLDWFVQVAKGMQYLQKKGIVHGNLAARNVLVNTPRHVKICDFNIHKMLNVWNMSCFSDETNLPMKWFAIECITEKQFSHYSDVWSYGITCWEILTFGKKPYPGIKNANMLSSLHYNIRPEQPSLATDTVYKLLAACWNKNCVSRPTFLMLIENFSNMSMDPSRYILSMKSECAISYLKVDEFFQHCTDNVVRSDCQKNCKLSENCNQNMLFTSSLTTKAFSSTLSKSNEESKLKISLTSNSNDVFIKTATQSEKSNYSGSQLYNTSLPNLLLMENKIVGSLPKIDYNANFLLTSIDNSDIIGVGSYGVIRRCHHYHLGNVVVKCMHFGGTSKSVLKDIEETKKRVAIVSTFRHENIVHTHGMTSWGQCCFGIIMEEIHCGNLRDLLIKHKPAEISWKLRFQIMQQLANALNYLHYHNPKKSYVHLDVKPENVLLTANLIVKLADFDSLGIKLATNVVRTMTFSENKQYTPFYASPERLHNMNEKTASSMDVYSFSMICYEIITRQEVFQDVRANVYVIISLISGCGQKPDKKYIDLVEQDVRTQSQKEFKIFQFLKYIMENCWCFKPQDRMSMKQVTESFVNFAGLNLVSEKEMDSCAVNVVNLWTQTKLTTTEVRRVPLVKHFPPFQQILSGPNNNRS